MVTQTLTLFTYPTITDFVEPESLRWIRRLSSIPPMGSLLVASLFRQQGYQVELVDTNKAYLEHLDSGAGLESFCDALAAKYTQKTSQLFGLSSICSSYYVTLDLARKLKERCPDAIIILGGPQATATAAETLRQCKYVDYVLGGETEESVGAFCSYRRKMPEKVPGLSWRTAEGLICSNHLKLLDDMDQQPLPAYDLWNTPTVMAMTIEAGRGCPFACKFCSTSAFFGRRYRLKSLTRIMAEVSELERQYQITRISLLHDNIFVSSKELAKFCDKWRTTPKVKDIRWSASFRVDFLNPSVIDILGRSNCSSVFLGVETGSVAIQKIINKNIDLAKARQSILDLNKRGISSTIALISGFPEETLSDYQDTLDFFFFALTKKLVSPQISTLSPLKGSGYFDELKHSLEFDENISAIAHQGQTIPEQYREAIKSMPELYSAHYSVPTVHLDRQELSETALFLTYTTSNFRWLLPVAALALKGLHRLALAWLAFRAKHSEDSGVPYYSSNVFYRQFIEFCADIEDYPDFKPEISACLRFCRDVYQVLPSEYDKLMKLSSSTPIPSELHGEEYLLTYGVLREVSYSFNALIETFNSDQSLTNLVETKTKLSIHLKDHDVIIEEVTPLGAAILQMFTKPTRLNVAIKKIEAEAPHLLSYLTSQRRAGLIFAVEVLLNRGLLTVCRQSELNQKSKAVASQ